MIRSILIFATIICCSKDLLSQKLFPFDEEQATWTFYVDRGFGAPDDASTYSLIFNAQDTIINGNTYAIVEVYRKDFQGISEGNELSFFREVNKKIYAYKQDGEILVYDFSNLSIGDSISAKGFTGAFPQDTISNIDSIQLADGSKRKRYEVSSIGCNSYLIEGIGSTKEFIPQLYGCAEYMAGLICHSVNGKVLYLDSRLAPLGNCPIITSSEEIVNIENFNSIIYPNPTQNGAINVKIFPTHENNLFNRKVKAVLYAATGKVITTHLINDFNTTFSVSNVPKGSYFLIFYMEEKGIYFAFKTEKIIVVND